MVTLLYGYPLFNMHGKKIVGVVPLLRIVRGYIFSLALVADRT